MLVTRNATITKTLNQALTHGARSTRYGPMLHWDSCIMRNMMHQGSRLARTWRIPSLSTAARARRALRSRCNLSALCCQKTLLRFGGCTQSRSAQFEKSVDKNRVQVNNMTAGTITSFNLLHPIPLRLEIKLCYDEIMDKHTSLYLSKIYVVYYGHLKKD